MAKATKESAAEAVSRTAGESYDLGLLIHKRYENYVSAIRRAIDADAQAADVEVSDFKAPEQAKMRFRFAPGLIVDFPEFSFCLAGLKVLGRACLTVCFNDTTSKVWCRFIVNPASGVGEPSRIEIGDPRLVFAASLCERINVVVGDTYLAHFTGTVPLKLRAESIRFERIGELNYIGLEEDPNIVSDLADRIERQDTTATDKTFVKLKKKLDALTKVIDDADDEGKPAVGGSQPYRIFSGREGVPAVFSSLLKDGTATFAVASSRSGPLPLEDQERLGRISNNSALDVTGELATLMASEF